MSLIMKYLLQAILSMRKEEIPMDDPTDFYLTGGSPASDALAGGKAFDHESCLACDQAAEPKIVHARVTRREAARLMREAKWREETIELIVSDQP